MHASARATMYAGKRELVGCYDAFDRVIERWMEALGYLAIQRAVSRPRS